ncbi:MCE family protein [Antrihabitans sp. YC2-6]|uniref:MCE family protein n=1 Tax=Antrihabitans sp. YC2-6 TaxID=2799498 RepID=UPI0018F6AE38|nr:MCE family protein [Antrihabitans sp. YC2-6]MBJ8344785.1 MCE family protein [Antrihabitans sp. YC2-6]
MSVGKKVGYLALGAAAVVLLGGAATSAVSSLDRDSKTMCAEFTDTVGLYEGNDVTLLGIEIGSVAAIEPMGDRMKVTMDIDHDIAVPADVGAVTMSSSIVTDRHVELTKPYTGGPLFEGAQCIPLTRTKTPLGISETFDAVNAVAADLLGSESDGGPGTPPDPILADALNSLDAALDGTGPTFNSLLGRLSTLVGDPADKDVVVRRLIDNLDRLTTMFVTNWPDFSTLLQNLGNGLEVVDGIASGLGTALAKANEFLPVAARTIDKYDEQSYAFLDKALPFSHQLLSRAGDIRDLLAYVPQASRDLMASLLGQAATR